MTHLSDWRRLVVDPRRGRLAATPSVLDRELLQDPEVSGTIIDAAKKEQDAKANQSRSQFRTVGIPGLVQDSVSGNVKKRHPAFDPADLVCDPVLQELDAFEQYSAVAFHEKIMSLSKKEKGARFATTKYQTGTSEGTRQLPKDLLLDYERRQINNPEIDYYKPVDDLPRPTVGGICRRGPHGHIEMSTKNIPRDKIRHQYYIRNVIVHRYADGGKRRTVVDIYLDQNIAEKMNQTKYVRLDSPSDWIMLNLRFPELDDSLSGFVEDARGKVQNEAAQIRALREEVRRMQHLLERRIAKQTSNMKEQLDRELGKRGFNGTVGKLSDCLIDAFDMNTGEFKDPTYLQCVNETIRSAAWFKKLREIQKLRSSNPAVLTDKGSFLNTVDLEPRNDPSDLDKLSVINGTLKFLVTPAGVTLAPRSSLEELDEPEELEATGAFQPFGPVSGSVGGSVGGSARESVVGSVQPEESGTPASSIIN